MNDDTFYEQVADELEAGTQKKGLWTRCFAEADGDENRAKAIYIKLRVAQLSAEEKDRVAEERRLEEENERAKEEPLTPEEEELKQWQAEEKEILPPSDMEGKSELFKSQYDLRSDKPIGCLGLIVLLIAVSIISILIVSPLL